MAAQLALSGSTVTDEFHPLGRSDGFLVPETCHHPVFLLPSLATIFQMVVLKTDGGGSGEQ